MKKINYLNKVCLNLRRFIYLIALDREVIFQALSLVLNFCFFYHGRILNLKKIKLNLN